MDEPMDYTSGPSTTTNGVLSPVRHVPWRARSHEIRSLEPSHSAASSTASSESDEDDPGAPDTHPRKGDDRNLRIEILDAVPTAPALATPNARLLGSHPWPFTGQAAAAAAAGGPASSSSAALSPTLGGVVGLGARGVGSSALVEQAGGHGQSGKAKVSEWLRTVPATREVPASSMPHEILLHILRCVTSVSDLRRALLVCKAWCQCGVELLWHKPSLTSTTSMMQMLVTLASKTQTFPYAGFIRRLNFSALADNVTDRILEWLNGCRRLERLTLSSCATVSDEAIIKMLRNVPDLVALDLSDCKLVSDAALVTAAESCLKLQGLNLTGCKNLTDIGIGSLKACRALRRLKLKGCEKVTDIGLTQVAANCPLLLEVDLVGCKLASNATLWTLWKNSSHLRELSLSGLAEISDSGFPSAENPLLAADGTTDPLRDEERLVGPQVPPPDGFSPPRMYYDHIRFLDLTSLVRLSDDAVAGIVRHMPRIRNLVLAKCSNLTDESLNSICKLGKHLHYLHLGHVSALTDRAVIQLARSCTRLRYIDLACCTNLTDMSVFELANCLPRLKRIGLVRVTNITDSSVNSLLERTSLERIHLSYCDHISVAAVHYLLQKLHRLTHLSLTGVPAFRRTDLQTFCRAPPKDFNSHQRQAFCVYSGKGVNELRRYLAALYTASGADSEDGVADVAVFNEMPDQRTMAVALAAVRAASSAQPNGVHSSRRRLGAADRSHIGTPPLLFGSGPGSRHHPGAAYATSVAGLRYPAAVGGALHHDGAPAIPLELSRRFHESSPSSNAGGGGGAGPSNATTAAAADDWDALSTGTVRAPRQAGSGGLRPAAASTRAEAQAGQEFFASAMGNQPTYSFGAAPSTARPPPAATATTTTLQSPIPLYSPVPIVPGNAGGGATDGRTRAFAAADHALGLGVGPSSRDRVASSEGAAGPPRRPMASHPALLRRRSTQEMSPAAASAVAAASGGGVVGGGGGGSDDDAVGSGGSGGRRRSRQAATAAAAGSALGLEVPDRAESASPMDLDLSDDERPDP